MNNSRKFALCSLFCCLLVAPAAFSQDRAVLPNTPHSGGFLMAKAIQTGQVQLPGRQGGKAVGINSTCSPAPCALPAVDAAEGGSTPVNETTVVVNPLNSNQLMSGGNDYNCASLQGVFNSDDGGATWRHGCLNLIAGRTGAGDVVLGYDRHGNAYAGGIDANAFFTTGVIATEKSLDNGLTWTVPRAAVQNILGGLTDKPWMEIDTNATSPHVNSVYISTTQFASNSDSQISVSHSSNGINWTTIGVSTRAIFPDVNQFSDLAVGRDGTVYLSWMRCSANGPTGDCGGTVAKMMFSKSSDGGNTWSAESQINTVNIAPDSCGAFYGCIPGTSERVSNIPVIAVDASKGSRSGQLYVIEYNYASPLMKVQVVSSKNGGATWGAPVSPASSSTHDQFFPWINVNASGAVGATWLDRRFDPANFSYDAIAAVSNDGANYGPNVRTSPTSSSPSNDGFGGGFMGDYDTNYWSGATLYEAWTDTTTGTAQDFVGGYRRR